MTYTLTNGPSVIRDSDKSFIPFDPANTDYQAYLSWVSLGNTATPYVPPATPAPHLTFLQFMALFTPAEQASIVNSTDTQVKLWLIMATGSGTIGLTDPDVVQGLAYAVSINLITAPRQTQILAGTPPS